MGNVVDVILGGGSAAIATYEGRKQDRAQRRALGEQAALQQQAVDAARRQARTAEENMNRANQKKPDLAAIFARAASAAQGGAASTQLTGPGGVPKKNLRLGETTLLGE